jgi:Gpi18-like mannosyltransferase
MAATVETDQVDPSTARRRSIISRLDRRLIAMVIAIKALVFIFAAQSYQIISNSRLNGFRGWMDTLTRWDTVHFLNIAQNGYSADGQDRILLAFFPLYPWATRVLAFVVGNYLIGGLLVSTIASIAAALLLLRLVQQDSSAKIAERAVWFLFIFPTSYFLHFAYTESLFIALTFGCILAARKKLWLVAGVLGALACLTRITGIILPPVLLAEAAQQYRQERRFDWGWLWIGVVPAGLLCYLIINWHVTGDPLAFLAIQKEYWYKSLAPPWIGIKSTFDSMQWRPASELQVVGVQEILFIALGLVCTIYSWANLRLSYSVWMTGNWLIFTSTSFVYSVPRYTLTLFPIYILFAQASEKPLVKSAITVWSLVYLALFTTLFVCGYWAF